MSTVPPLGWAGTVGMVVVIVGLVVGIVFYHVWLDRRLKAERERAAGTGTPRR
jgi:heme/copper-type cytochrome/quinol oxidase subunit 2